MCFTQLSNMAAYILKFYRIELAKKRWNIILLWGRSEF